MPTNAQLAELLALAAAQETDHRQRALRRASRAAAFTWTEEAADVAASGRSLTELTTVGPWVAKVITAMLDDPPDAGETPELRRGFLTLAEVRASLASAPEWRREVRADLQMHTTYTDGSATLREMVAEAATYGYEHVAITDHSKGLPIAHGMDEAAFAKQAKEIAEVNADLERDGSRMRVLRGIEMNISPEGEGDMDPDMLATLDIVLGAFHSKLRVKEDQTDRYLKAIANPTVHVLAHPRGRRYDHRIGLRADWRTVARAAADADKALEIDAYPDRQDLDVELLAHVREAGGRVSIGTDAHHPSELRFIEFGLAAAIRAGIGRDRVINFLRRDELLAWTGSLRRRNSPRRGGRNDT